MPLVERFDPPAFLPDFVGIPGQAEAWHRAVSAWFDSSIESERPKVKAVGNKGSGTVQFYNPSRFDPGGPSIQQAILWNAFPKELLRQFGRERSLIEADKLRPLSDYSPRFTSEVDKRTLYRPLNEYCEWHVVRDPDTQKIVRVTFTSEPPEFWQALFGDMISTDGTSGEKFPGNRDRVLGLYRDLVSPEVQMQDLIASEDIPDVGVKEGQYNIYNKWNTSHGIMHLCAPPNSLFAEIQLGADATVLRHNAQGRPVVEASPLICCANYGGPDRNSDPTIGSTVNALARAGAWITLPNPVGLYMDHIDLAGWTAMDGGPVSDCVRIIRGMPRMIERLVVEVPSNRGFKVSDLRIGGVPIEYGGQIAECITVKLVGAASALGSVHNSPIPCEGRCCVDPYDPVELSRPIPLTSPTPAGEVDAFQGEGGLSTPAEPVKHRFERREHVAQLRRVRWV